MGFSYNKQRAQEAGVGCLPPGEYDVRITDAKDHETQRGGAYIKLTFMVMKGKYQGEEFFDMYNYRNDNKKAEDIAWRSLRKLTGAIFGDENHVWNDLETLIGKKLKVVTRVETSQSGYDTARVKTYITPEKATNPEQKEFLEKKIQEEQDEEQPVRQSVIKERVRQYEAHIANKKNNASDDDDVPF